MASDTHLWAVPDYPHMQVIDERGYLFGVVNIIDALVVLLVLAVVLAGVALVTGSSELGAGDETESQIIVFRTAPYPDFVTASIPEGSVGTEDVVAVHEKSISEVGGENQSEEPMTRARIRVELVVQPGSDGLPQFHGERLYVGRELRLDLQETIVDGLVVDIKG